MKSNVKRDCFVLWIGLFFLGLVAALTVMVVSVSAQAQSPAQLRLLQSDASRVVLELETPGYEAREQIVDGQAYTVLSVSDLGQTGEAGRPQLPVKGALIGIPVGARATLEVLDDWAVRQPLAHPPLPVPALQVNRDPAQTLPAEPERRFIPDKAVYLGQQLYPTQAARIASVGQWRSQRILTVVFHPLQYDPAARQLIWHRRLRVEITFQYEPAATGALTGAEPAGRPGQPVDEGAFEPVLSQALLNYASAQDWRVATRESPKPAGARTVLGPWYKVAVNADGIYTLTCSQLADAGIDLASLDPRTLKIYKGENELAIHVVGEADGICHPNDYVEFFGRAVNTKYTNTNVYWLTYGGAAGQRMMQRDGRGTGAPVTAFTDTLHLEQDRYYRSYFPVLEDADHWFWNYISNAYADYAFATDHLATGDLTATVQVDFYGYAVAPHHAQVYVNGHLIHDAVWSGQTEYRTTIPFPQAYLITATNTLSVSTSTVGDYVFVNSFDIGYARTFTATNDVLHFRQAAPGAWQYQMAGFTTPEAETFDISDAYSVTRIVSTTVTPVDGTYALQFADANSSPREYLALAPVQRKSPVSIIRAAPSDLLNRNNGADYIVISYGGFITNVQPLANYRAAQGMRVQVVDVQDVYDEFSDGLMDAQAIHDFLKYAYINWQKPAPGFVLLVGDGNFDFKNHLGTGEPNYIPPYLRLVDPVIGETASDNRLVAFDVPTSTLPSLAIGRLPADSAADVDTMVAKILNYEQSPVPGSWRSTVTFVTGDAYNSSGTRDPAGNFWEYSDSIASNPFYLPAPMSADRIYYNPCPPSTYPQCVLPYTPYTTSVAVRTALTKAINDGRLIVNYIGHSSPTFWGSLSTGEQLFGKDDVSGLSNGRKLPVMLAMTCYDGYFHYPGLSSLAEVNVRQAGGGALASWSASGQGLTQGHEYLDQGFFEAVVQRKVYQIGLAADWGKVNLWINSGGTDHDLIDTFNLFGDPASRLAVAPDVAIAKTVSPGGAMLIGTPITYTLAFTNIGQLTADNVMISDLLPATLLAPQLVSSGVPITRTGSTRFEWTVGSLPPGTGGLITITAMLDPVRAHWPSAWLTNTATITTTLPQSNVANDWSVAVTPVRFPIYLPVVLRQ